MGILFIGAAVLWRFASHPRRRSIVAERMTTPAIIGATLRSGRALAMSQPTIYHLRGGIDELAGAFPETVERYGEVERFAPGIRPLRLSFALLWDTLFRALPGVRDDSRPAPSPGGTSALFIDILRLA
jgi:hypothetical protein